MGRIRSTGNGGMDRSVLRGVCRPVRSLMNNREGVGVVRSEHGKVGSVAVVG